MSQLVQPSFYFVLLVEPVSTMDAKSVHAVFDTFSSALQVHSSPSREMRNSIEQ